MAVSFSLTCDCGKVRTVTGGDAGSRILCECRRMIEVPNLGELRRAAGVPTVSPELIIEAMIRDGEVPGDTNCLKCGATSNDLCVVPVVCERQHTKIGGWKVNPFALFFLWIRFEATEERELGRNIAYRLPLRICQPCRRDCSRKEVTELLRSIDVYRQLLDKYPHASIGRLTIQDERS